VVIFYLKEMGIPIQKLVCASNTNNVLTDFFASGKYDIRDRHIERSTSPSIDILKSSNLERFLYHMTKDGPFVRKLFQQLATEKYFEVRPSMRIVSYLSIGYLDSSISSKLFYLEVQ
jgi:threonine synthase